MANQIATSTWVTNEVARYFVNSLKFASNVNRTYDDAYQESGAKVGYTVNARLPQRWQVTDGQAFQLQNILDLAVPITLTNQKNIAFSWGSAQATMELDRIRERYVQPAAESLANAADAMAFQAVYADVYSAVGVPGVTPSATLTYLQAGVKMTDLSTPDESRVAVLDPLAMATIANTATNLFNPQGAISDTYRNGQVAGRALGYRAWYEDQNRPVHTTGSFTSCTPQVTGANQTGSALNTNNWASGASTLRKGDVFTIAGVYGVNPLSYVSTGRLQQFVVTSTVSDTSGSMTINISPAIIPSGQLQTVTASPADLAAIIPLGSTITTGAGTMAATVSPVSMCFHPDAFAFVMADLVSPNAGARSTTVRSKQWGIAIRYVEQYQVGNDQNANRLDILIGAATVQARLACRVQG